MKKITLLLSTLLLFGWSWMGISCSDDDDSAPEPEPAPENEKSELEQDYFNIDEGTYVAGDFPVATTEEPIEGLNINSQALKGGMNFITVVSEKVYKKFFVGVKGVPGYFEYVPEEQAPAPELRSANQYHSYSIPIMYSTNFGEDITMLISALDMEGIIYKQLEKQVTFVESLSGDLNINLTFSADKDVDLHLITPDSIHIYYGNRGGDVILEDDTLSFGLDKDSNAGCSIDGLNNENIYIPGELIKEGEYTIVVNMYRNCWPHEVPTYWTIAARYKGEFIPVTTGVNPASGVYDVDAADDDMTVVMTFTIHEKSNRSVREWLNSAKFVPFPMTDAEILKVEEAALR